MASVALSGCVELDDPELDETEAAVRAPPPSNLVLYVNAATTVRGNGSLAKPFKTINQALAAAASANALATTINVAAGTYAESVPITRSTTLIGASRTGTVIAGSVYNGSPSALSIRSLTVSAPPSSGGISSQGTTTLTSVTVANGYGYGVQQLGGSLTADGLQVSGSRPFGTSGDGAAVHVAAGARATLTGLYATSNSQGILAEGTGTIVSATSLGIVDTIGAVLPSTRPRSAAVNVSNGAHVQVDGGDIRNSRGTAIALTGATSRFSNLTVQGFTSGAPLWGGNDVSWGLVATQGSHVEAIKTHFIGASSFNFGTYVDTTSRATIRSDLDFALSGCPELLSTDWYNFCVETYVQQHASWIRDFAVGITNGDTDDLHCSTWQVGTWVDNDVNANFATLPLPPLPSLPGTEPPPSDSTEPWLAGCVSVPWR